MKSLISADIVSLQQLSAQTRAPIGDAPAGSVRFLFAIQREAANGQFLAALPYESPSATARNPLTHTIHFCGAVNLSPGLE